MSRGNPGFRRGGYRPRPAGFSLQDFVTKPKKESHRSTDQFERDNQDSSSYKDRNKPDRFHRFEQKYSEIFDATTSYEDQIEKGTTRKSRHEEDQSERVSNEFIRKRTFRGNNRNDMQVSTETQEDYHGVPRQIQEKEMNLSKLQSIASMRPKELLQLVVQKRQGFLKLLHGRKIPNEIMSLIVQIIHRTAQCSLIPAARLKLLNEVYQSGFLKVTLSSFLSSVTQTSSLDIPLHEILYQCTSFLETLLVVLPSSLPDVMVALGGLQVCKDKTYEDDTSEHLIGTCSANISRERLEDKIDNLIEMIGKMQKERRKQIKLDKLAVEDQKKPPDNFRELSVFPQPNDIFLLEQPFLRANKDVGGYQDLDHYLDVQFRLMREDLISPLRDGILEYKELQKQLGRRIKPKDVKLYFDVKIKHGVCTENGIHHCIQFNTRRLARVQWNKSKRLIFGALVCLSADDFETMIFATVTDRNPKELQNGILHVNFRKNVNLIVDHTFIMAESTAFFGAYEHTLIGLQKIDRSMPFQEYIVSSKTVVKPPRYLIRDIEGNVTTYNFGPVIEKKSEPTEPGGKIYANKENVYGAVPVLQMAKWPSTEEFGLDDSQTEALKLALTNEFAVIQGPPGTGKTHVGLKIAKVLLINRVKWLDEETVVDKKTNRKTRRLVRSPLLVVCYTNHALDQFLEGILDMFPPNSNRTITRVGSRCENEKVKECSIGILRNKIPMSTLLRQNITESKNAIKAVDDELRKAISRMKSTEKGILTEESLKPVMKLAHYQQLMDCKDGSPILEWLGLGQSTILSEDDREQIVGTAEQNGTNNTENDKNDESDSDDSDDIEDDQDYDINKLETENRKTEDETMNVKDVYNQIEADVDILVLSVDQITRPFTKSYPSGLRLENMEKTRRHEILEMKLKAMEQRTDFGRIQSHIKRTSLWKLSIPERWSLYELWVYVFRSQIKNEISKLEEKYEIEQAALAEANSRADEECMKISTVIGMTTTGAAKHWNVLQNVKPKIIIVEEAAEVLESHIVTTLSAGCEHLILIGDHKQLRPNPSVYKLAKKYNLEISLFERMVNNGMKCITLEKQHRMRPEIAQMIKPIYPDLQNHDSVLNYDEISGVAKNIFFVDHNYEESAVGDTKSHTNEHEAAYIAALCRYFLKQGYSPDQITVLTTYSGQMFALRKLMPHRDYGVHISVVDNFQGEENDIILLSLVRSNTENSIGFLATENRVCVALSRAKMGFYIIGNMTLLASISDMWSEILHLLRKQDAIGPHLELYCKNHPDTKINASDAKDFQKAPEGGCLRPCEYRLNCGHACVMPCHIIDPDHKAYKCKKPCLETCARGHPCEDQCFEECSECKYVVQKACPKCTYEHNVPCYFQFQQSDTDFNKYKCTRPCPKTLCHLEHPCPDECYEDCDICKVPVEKRCPKCSTEKTVPCHFEFNPKDRDYKLYRCSEPCPKMLCEKDHPCPDKCYKNCKPCKVMVDKECPKCSKIRKVPCHFNFQEVDQEYELYKCVEPCSVKLCSVGHHCPKQCYEMCDLTCKYIVDKECPKCLCSKEVPCYFRFKVIDMDYNKFRCTQPCSKIICDNDHLCQKECWETCAIKCKVEMKKENPKCFHMNLVPCYFKFQNDLYPCPEKCEKKCDLDHPCRLKCGEKCYCDVLTEKENPICHHTYEVPCSFEFAKYKYSRYMYYSEKEKYNKCMQPCNKKCKMGHSCTNKCFDECSKCMVLVEKENPLCHHKYNVPCSFNFSLSRIIRTEGYDKCQEPCSKSLCSNDHICPKKCYEKCGKCMVMIERENPVCKHKCIAPCSHEFLTSRQEEYKYQMSRNKYDKCTKPCEREVCDQGHKCNKQCFEECEDCMVMIERENPKCKHKNTVACSYRFNEARNYWVNGKQNKMYCTENCEKTLPCGHTCTKKCFEPCTKKCNFIVERKLLCGHTIKMECNKDISNFACNIPCKELLSCGHTCGGSCSQCSEGKIHKPCMEQCEKVLICGHRCKSPCSRICPPCQEACEFRCSHGKCGMQCGLVCKPCRNPCQWRCKHKRCTKHCFEACNREPCNEKCNKFLKCNHPCAGLCGEPCPNICRICDKDKLLELLGDSLDIELKNVRLLQLADCKHVFDAKYLDRIIQGQDNEGMGAKSCPTCGAMIKTTLRYDIYNKMFCRNINLAKQIYFSNIRDPNSSRQQIFEKISKYQNETVDINWLINLVRRFYNNPETMEALENMFEVWKRINVYHKHQQACQKVCDKPMNIPKNCTETTVMQWCKRERKWLGIMELEEAHNEVTRVLFYLHFTGILCVAPEETQEQSSLISQITGFLDELNTIRITPQEISKYSAAVTETRSQFPNFPALPLEAEIERRQINITRQPLIQGDWRKCSEGHIYAVMGEGCPQCKAHLEAPHQLMVNQTLLSKLKPVSKSEEIQIKKEQNKEHEQQIQNQNPANRGTRGKNKSNRGRNQGQPQANFNTENVTPGYATGGQTNPRANEQSGQGNRNNQRNPGHGNKRGRGRGKGRRR